MSPNKGAVMEVTAWPGCSTEVYSRPAHSHNCRAIEIFVRSHDQWVLRPTDSPLTQMSGPWHWLTDIRMGASTANSEFLAVVIYGIDGYHIIVGSSPADSPWHEMYRDCPGTPQLSFGIMF